MKLTSLDVYVMSLDVYVMSLDVYVMSLGVYVRANQPYTYMKASSVILHECVAVYCSVLQYVVAACCSLFSRPA